LKTEKKEFYSFIIKNSRPKLKLMIINSIICILSLVIYIFGICDDFSFLFPIAAASFSVLTQGLIAGNYVSGVVFLIFMLALKSGFLGNMFYQYPEFYCKQMPIFFIFFWIISCESMFQIYKFLFKKNNYKHELERRISRERKRIGQTSLDFINSLMEAYILKYPSEKSHIHNVAEYSSNIAKKMKLNSDLVWQAYWAGLLHDVGKIRFSDDFMKINDKDYTPEQFDLFKTHVTFGGELLEKLALGDIAMAVRFHHERWNGSGYPEGLKGDEIPIIAQIVAVANKIDRMLAENDKRKLTPEQIVELQTKSNINYSPDVVETAIKFL